MLFSTFQIPTPVASENQNIIGNIVLNGCSMHESYKIK